MTARTTLDAVGTDGCKVTQETIPFGSFHARRIPPVETPAARTTDPETSHIAAEQITKIGTRARHQREVLELLNRCDGRTSAELAELAQRCAGLSHLDRHAVARRLPELATAGLVRRGATVVCKANGTKATSWWVTTAGKESLR